MMQRFRQQAGGTFGGFSGGARLGGPAAAGGESAGGSGLPDFASLSLSRSALQRFTPEQRANATLPAPPEKGSDVDILLRPGLLADSEIIVEHLSDTLYVPFQGIFHEGTQPIVYVKKGDSFEVRKVELGLRSESQIAVRSGLEEGELIALSPPNGEDAAAAAEKKKKAQPAQQPFPGAAGGSDVGGAPAAGGGRRRR
jgi:hypothetical protein